MIDFAEIKTVAKENTHEFLSGSYGDYRQQPKEEVLNTAQAVAYDELSNNWMNGEISGEEVSKMAQEIAEELAADCPAE